MHVEKNTRAEACIKAQCGEGFHLYGFGFARGQELGHYFAIFVQCVVRNLIYFSFSLMRFIVVRASARGAAELFVGTSDGCDPAVM